MPRGQIKSSTWIVVIMRARNGTAKATAVKKMPGKMNFILCRDSRDPVLKNIVSGNIISYRNYPISS